jgi:hypothetical protein
MYHEIGAKYDEGARIPMVVSRKAPHRPLPPDCTFRIVARKYTRRLGFQEVSLPSLSRGDRGYC